MTIAVKKKKKMVLIIVRNIDKIVYIIHLFHQLFLQYITDNLLYRHGGQGCLLLCKI